MTEQQTIPARVEAGSLAADPRWTNVVVGAVLTWVVAHVLMMALTRELIPALIATSVLGIVIAMVAVRRPVVGAWVAAIVSGVHIVLSMRFTVIDIQHPESPPAFLHAVFAGLGMLVAIAAGVAIIRDREFRPRPLLLGAGTLALIGVLISAVATLTATSDPAGGQDTTLVAERIQWVESSVTVPTGGTIYLDNTDLARHTFTVEGTAIDVEMPAARARLVTIDLSPGSYPFICDVPGHENMTGTLTVTE